MTQLGRPYANQLGTGNGAGVTVGVVDSGLQLTHPTLKGQVLATYNAFTGSTDVTDQMGHGTHVSGLIAGSLANGSLTEGVAPGAKLVMAKVFQTGSTDSLTIQRGIDWVVNTQKAPILSLSLGSSVLSLQAPIQNAVAKGALITAALGNDGKTNAASWPAEFAKASWAKGQIIAVGAVDAANQRASFSNVDPTLANWTVYAPGVNVASSYSVPTMQNAYVYMSGTSMATPIVAGQGRPYRDVTVRAQ
jgi:subtilisin family serine protease